MGLGQVRTENGDRHDRGWARLRVRRHLRPKPPPHSASQAAKHAAAAPPTAGYRSPSPPPRSARRAKSVIGGSSGGRRWRYRLAFRLAYRSSRRAFCSATRARAAAAASVAIRLSSASRAACSAARRAASASRAVRRSTRRASRASAIAFVTSRRSKKAGSLCFFWNCARRTRFAAAAAARRSWRELPGSADFRFGIKPPYRCHDGRSTPGGALSAISCGIAFSRRRHGDGRIRPRSVRERIRATNTVRSRREIISAGCKSLHGHREAPNCAGQFGPQHSRNRFREFGLPLRNSPRQAECRSLRIVPIQRRWRAGG
jgi:hypothetical protein